MSSQVGTNGADPHRVLGVAREATEAEIKRAYRALAKRHHPDAAQGSVDRFLEIQAAYETLVGGSGGPLPGTTAGRPARTTRRPAQPDRPAAAGGGPGSEGPWASARGPAPGTEWARRPRGGSARRPDRGPGDGTGGAPRGEPGSGEDAGSAGATGTTGAGAARTSGGRPAAGGTPPGRRSSNRRRATLGSTSYDEAGEAFEPDWGGASWYGPSSGTYWTLNPREYADPRKHGPEYQARARRRAGAGTGPAPDEALDTPDAGFNTPDGGFNAPDGGFDTPPGETAADAPPGTRPGEPRPDPNAATPPADDLPPSWRSQAWTAASPPGAARPAFEHGWPSSGPPAQDESSNEAERASDDRPGPGPADPPWRAPRPNVTPARPAASPGAGAVIPAAHGPGIPARVALAIAGWLVPGLALAAAAAGLPGGLVATVPLQAAGAATLALVPRAAWALAGGGLALALAALPIVAVVAALGGPFVPGGPAPEAAVVLAALAWAAGVFVVGAGRIAPYPWRPGA